jgi:NAD(P)-dependent dehydrogenase (short-subunit alcohol dehydrogenase family)
MARLEGFTAVITGGCGDIGKATARCLAAEGAGMMLIDVVAESEGGEFAQTLSNGKGAFYVCCDICDRSQVDQAFSRAKSRFGRIDVVISNAGIVKNQPFLEITAEAWKETLDVNLTGCFHVGQAAARMMNEQEPNRDGLRGKILFTGSWVQDMPWPEGTSYIVSKAGLKALARNMAQELAGRGIRVNVVAPGIVMAGLSRKVYETDPAFGARATAAIPVGEFGTAQQVAEAFLFLAGNESNYMTGSVLLIDGGASLVKR